MPRQRELSETTSHPRPGTHRRRRGVRRRHKHRAFGRPEALALLAGLTIAGAGYLTANAFLAPGGNDDVTVQMDPVEEPSADAHDVLDRLPASASRGVQRPTASPTPTPTRPTATPTGPTTTATPENTPAAVPSPEPAPPEPEAEPDPPEPDPAPPPQPSPSSPPSTTASAPSSGASAAEAAVVDVVNEERARAGCPSVRGEAGLHDLARRHSADMAARGYFDHTDPDGRTPWDRAEAAGISGVGGENIAMGAPDARSVMEMWMDSPGHRANILNCDFTRIGVGMHAGSGGGPWWTQVFGY